MIGGVCFTHVPFGLNGKPVGGKTAINSIARDSVYDTVFGHTHRAGFAECPKLGRDQRVVAINLGCALPQGYVMPYAKDSGTGWWWGAWNLHIQGGRIQGHQSIPMMELEDRYGSSD